MDTELFMRIIHNLLQTAIVRYDRSTKSALHFEESHCFNKILQPMFTAEALTFILDSVLDNTIYEVQDRLNVCLMFFKFRGEIYIVGPYVKSSYSEKNMEALLMENHISSSFAIPLKLYYTAYPILYSNSVQNTITSVMQSFDPSCAAYSYRRLSGFISDDDSRNESTNIEPLDYSLIYRRYDTEKQFLDMIREGDVENIRRAYNNMADSGTKSGFIQTSEVYANPIVGFTIVRTLARKAAEESGLSVITINEITQKYVQLSDSADMLDDQLEYIIDMIEELTIAVHKFKTGHGKYTEPVRKTLEYVYLHQSENLSLSLLAKNVNVSDSYLSKIFKSETGETLSEYIANCRCKKAAELLKTTNQTIAEISSFVGYDDNNYFVKVFKKSYGLTPSEYRKNS